MKKFEYRHQRFQFEETHETDPEVVRQAMIAEFNILGLMGWEIVNVVSMNLTGTTFMNLILKRELP